MRLRANKRTITLLAAGLALVVFAFAGVIWWLNGNQEIAMRRLQEKKREVQEGERIRERREEVMTLLKEDQMRLQFLEQGVSDATYVPTLLRQMEQLARNTSNDVIAVRPQIIVEAPTRLQQRRDPEATGKETKVDEEAKKKAMEPYVPLGVEVHLVGNYDSIQAFLQQLQRFPKIIAVESLNMKPNSGYTIRGGQLEVTAELRLKAFIMKQDQVPAETVPAKQAGVSARGGTG